VKPYFFMQRSVTKELSHETKKHLIILTVLFVASAALGYAATISHPDEASKFLGTLVREIKETVRSFGKTSLFLFIFGTNTAKAFLIMIFGTFFGIAPVLFIIFNGFILGLMGTLIAFSGGVHFFTLGIAPHGIFEIPGVLLASAYGLMLGKAFLQKLRRGGPFQPTLLTALRQFGVIVLPLLAIAAFIEVFVTSALLQMADADFFILHSDNKLHSQPSGISG
jgi:stage II sporulation protein M